MVAALTLAGAPAAARAADPCPSQTHFEWMGESVSETVSIPSLTQPDGIAAYDGTILRPADTGTFGGLRPVVLLQHGAGGNQCAQWWTAQDLAGHGYVTMLWRSPPGDNNVEGFRNAVDAMRSAIVFMRGAANPYADVSDTDRIGLLGHSLGSVVVSYVQQDLDPGIRAIVAFDTLRRWLNGDPGGAVNECAAEPTGEVTPRVPALGFAMDKPCAALPDVNPPDLKLAGFERWREAGVPSMELVMAGYNHLDFASPGSEEKHRDLAFYVEAWFDRWLGGDVAATDRLLAGSVFGRPAESLLSTQYLSGAYLRTRVDTADYRAFLSDTKAPNTTRKSGPTGEISRRRARSGVTFRFRADDPLAGFECRLDRSKWKACDSPKRIGSASLRPGAHSFEARATDQRGNVERKPAVWRLRVLPRR